MSKCPNVIEYTNDENDRLWLKDWKVTTTINYEMSNIKIKNN